MFGVGFLFAVLGLYLVDCAVQGRHPITTLEAMITDPGNARATLKGTKHEIVPGTLVSNGGSGATPVAPSVAITGAGSGAAATAVSFARAQIGKPYKWGATGPNAYDCSGLVQAAYKAAGVSIPRTTYGQVLVGTKVNKSDLIPGDLVFPDPGHVQIYSGGGNIVEAPHTGEDVMERPMWGFWTARRIVPVTAPTSTTYQGA